MLVWQKSDFAAQEAVREHWPPVEEMREHWRAGEEMRE
jgi:hypothetical protein